MKMKSETHTMLWYLQDMLMSINWGPNNYCRGITAKVARGRLSYKAQKVGYQTTKKRKRFP